MNLLWFLVLSITKGDYELDSMHDVGTGNDLLNGGMTVERRSFISQTLDTGPCELKS